MTQKLLTKNGKLLTSEDKMLTYDVSKNDTLTLLNNGELKTLDYSNWESVTDYLFYKKIV